MFGSCSYSTLTPLRVFCIANLTSVNLYLYKLTGSFDKSFKGVPKIAGAERLADRIQASTKFSGLFGGTQDKCFTCTKIVYPVEKVQVDSKSYHKSCFRCARGGCVISPSNYVAHEQRIYCRHHHSHLFKAKGYFSQLTKP